MKKEAKTYRKSKKMRAFILSFPKKCALVLIGFYRNYISPLFPPSCRYVPSCSEYAMIAFQRFGFLNGLWLTIKRVSRCHPWHPGGYDPVPTHLNNKVTYLED